MTPDPLEAAVTDALGVGPDAQPDVVRSAFLRTLRDTDLMPTPAAVEAAGLAGRFPRLVRPAPTLRATAEVRLQTAVEQFADEYWALAPPARRARWAELSSVCDSYPRVRNRLQDLAAGLDLTMPGGEAGPLAAAILELYPLKPAAQAVARRRLRDKISPMVANALRRTHPELSRLDHGLLRQFLREPPPLPDIDLHAPTVPQPGASKSKLGGHAPWLIPVCVILGLTVLKAVFRSASDSSGPSTNVFNSAQGPTLENRKPFTGMGQLAFYPHQWRILDELSAADTVPPEQFQDLARRFRAPPIPAESQKLPRPQGERTGLQAVTLLRLKDANLLQPSEVERLLADFVRRRAAAIQVNGPPMLKPHQVNTLNALAGRDAVGDDELTYMARDWLAPRPPAGTDPVIAKVYTAGQLEVARALRTAVPATLEEIRERLRAFVVAGKADRAKGAATKRP